jgi:hypothetical protein
MESAIKLECTNKDLDTWFYFPCKATRFTLSTIECFNVDLENGDKGIKTKQNMQLAKI